MIDEVVELIDRHSVGAGQKPDQTRIEIARARTHHQSRCRSGTHRRVNTSAVADRCQARTRAEVG